MMQQTEIAVYPSPSSLRRDLPLWAFGLEGSWLPRHLAGKLAALAAVRPKFSGIADRLAAWNFERAPLDPVFAADARAAGRRLNEAPVRRSLLRELCRRLRRPESARDFAALADAPDPGPALAWLKRGINDPADGLFWCGRGFAFALARGMAPLARDIAARVGSDPALAPLGGRLAAEAALAWDGPPAIKAALDRLDAACFPRFAALAAADLLAESGDAGGAAAVLARLWRAENWHPDLTARLSTLLCPPAPVALETLPGRLHVFVYTWNRAELLTRTLDSLAESRLGPARVTVLDNGSTDDTAAVCRSMAGRFAPERFTVLRLPVNVGAPVARNWLAQAAGLGPDDLAAYVDDDVSLPPEWLESLASALAADSAADVAGARIVAAAPGAARVAQAADVRLLPPDAAHSVRPLVNSGPGPDLGLLACLRPCASVSGCCHLFRGQALAGPAPFDLRFSPSQFDDLTRDLTGFQAGRRAVYAGTLAVAHHQHAGPGQARSPAAVGQLLGARTKLDGLFPREQMLVAAGRDLDTAWESLENGWRAVRQRLDEKKTG
ncbi:glycosyltransferase family 2 protein [Desulfovibrio sp. TomC]|uniref:glycosyltransferase family 2 protein n=1 Tax=Desulfovibrio sp. TomC TaxID=1562888 RepID=UPI0005744AC3|nr:glycosyltransferase family 2 protein [Desulfovibrio sp. TomC]KHK00784.1 Glycosyl transferase, group 2 family protein [Desulfovibrio sp. TomC]